MNEKNVKIIKRAHILKGLASSYNPEILNPFHPELYIWDTELAIRNKLNKLLSELREFKLLTALVSVLKKIESER